MAQWVNPSDQSTTKTNPHVHTHLHIYIHPQTFCSSPLGSSRMRPDTVVKAAASSRTEAAAAACRLTPAGRGGTKASARSNAAVRGGVLLGVGSCQLWVGVASTGVECMHVCICVRTSGESQEEETGLGHDSRLCNLCRMMNGLDWVWFGSTLCVCGRRRVDPQPIPSDAAVGRRRSLESAPHDQGRACHQPKSTGCPPQVPLQSAASTFANAG